MPDLGDGPEKLTPDQLELLTQAALAFKRFWNNPDEANARVDFTVGMGLLQELMASRDNGP